MAGVGGGGGAMLVDVDVVGGGLVLEFGVVEAVRAEAGTKFSGSGWGMV